MEYNSAIKNRISSPPFQFKRSYHFIYTLMQRFFVSPTHIYKRLLVSISIGTFLTNYDVTNRKV